MAQATIVRFITAFQEITVGTGIAETILEFR